MLAQLPEPWGLRSVSTPAHLPTADSVRSRRATRPHTCHRSGRVRSGGNRESCCHHMAKGERGLMRRRRFGFLRRLPSGRFQASFTPPTGKRQTATTTFRTDADASRYLDASTRHQVWPLGEGPRLGQSHSPRVLRGLSGGERPRRQALGRDMQAEHALASDGSARPADLDHHRSRCSCLACERCGVMVVVPSIIQSYRLMRSVLVGWAGPWIPR